MKQNFLYILTFLTLAVSPCRGQECKGVSIANSSIKVENVRVSHIDKQLTLSMTLNLDQLQMPTNNQFVLYQTNSVVYAAKLEVQSAAYGITQESLTGAFRLMGMDLKKEG